MNEFIVALSATIINIILVVFLLARGIKKFFSADLFFVILILSITFWSLSLGISETTDVIHLSDLFGRMSFGFSGMVLYSSYISVLSLSPRPESIKSSSIKKISIASALVIPIFFTKYVYSVPDITTFQYGPGIYLYAFYFLVVLGLIINEYRFTSKLGTAIQKQRVRLISWGLCLLIGIVGVMNVLLPAVLGNEELARLSPIASVVYAFIVVYAIARHKLFEFRIIVARSAAYIFALGFLGLIYGVVAFVFVDALLFDNFQASQTFRRLTYVSIALITGLSFTPMKKLFDRISKKIFFRDAYDPQSFIDNMTSLLVSTIDIGVLLENSSQLINSNLKSSFCEFIISGKRRKHESNENLPILLDEKDNEKIIDFVKKVKNTVSMVDDFDTDSTNSTILLLKKANISLVVKLKSRDKFIGVLLIGNKKSGSSFSNQDSDVLQIVADELALAIENSLSYEEISSFNETLQGKVSDATKQLRHTNTKLKALDETKDEFISMASHQLRTPLTSVKGYLSMVLDGDAGELNEQQKKLLNQAFMSSQRMVYLISDLLNVSRLHTGKFVIETKPTSLPEVILSELDQLKEAALVKNIDFAFNPPEEFPMLKLDETKTRQVIMNFLDNSLYYTPAGGKVKVELSESEKSVEFRVIDNGLGVPKNEQHHLFGKFYRAENARRARPDGTGLGLFMAKKVVIAQGGAIIFNSQEGKGSTFGFSFPKVELEVKKAL
ncbi:MAG: ATP-binding protein [bacterium]|nr:ATP-binding protein [bacterium]